MDNPTKFVQFISLKMLTSLMLSDKSKFAQTQQSQNTDCRSVSSQMNETSSQFPQFSLKLANEIVMKAEYHSTARETNAGGRQHEYKTEQTIGSSPMLSCSATLSFRKGLHPFSQRDND